MPRLLLTPSNLLEDVRASFWALPAAGLLGALGLAGFTHALDLARFAPKVPPTDGFVGAVHVDTVRRLLVALATAAAGITGIAFSVTITTLALASQQFGPHVLRTYMQRRFVQAVLAAFVGTVLYALVSLHWLGAAERVDYLPAATAGATLALAVLDLVLLVLFVHFTATTIQVDSIVQAVHEDFVERLPTLFPPATGGRGPDALDGSDIDATLAAGTGTKLAARRSGYLQTIDRARLVALAARHDVRIAVAHEPGAWVMAGVTLATVHAPSDAPGVAPVRLSADAIDRLGNRLHRLVVLGRSPTPEQDPRFALRQLQQVALRALSPALNDPQTAASCISRIGAIVSELLPLEGVRHRFVDAGGTVRLVERRSDPGELVAFALDAPVRAGGGRADTAADLVRTLRILVELHPESPWLDRLDAQLERIATALAGESLDPVDAERLSALIGHARARVARAKAPGTAADAPEESPERTASAREARRVTASRGSAGTAP